MMLSKQEVQSMYQSGAKYYDFTTLLYRLIGLRMKAYRSHAVRLLHLKRGDFVVELSQFVARQPRGSRPVRTK